MATKKTTKASRAKKVLVKWNHDCGEWDVNPSSERQEPPICFLLPGSPEEVERLLESLNNDLDLDEQIDVLTNVVKATRVAK